MKFADGYVHFHISKNGNSKNIGAKTREDAMKIVNKHFSVERSWKCFSNMLRTYGYKQMRKSGPSIVFANDKVTSLECILLLGSGKPETSGVLTAKHAAKCTLLLLLIAHRLKTYDSQKRTMKFWKKLQLS